MNVSNAAVFSMQVKPVFLTSKSDIFNELVKVIRCPVNLFKLLFNFLHTIDDLSKEMLNQLMIIHVVFSSMS